jgi:hypothetical protein
MARLYLDHNVQAGLIALGHMAVLTRDQPNMVEASDGHQLLFAAQVGATLLTHDRKDFPNLHDAWRRWQVAWGCGPDHAGIFILDQRVPPDTLVKVVHELITSGQPLTNELYRWTIAGGWQHVPYEP